MNSSSAISGVRIALLKYGAGNTHSVVHAFKRLGHSLTQIEDVDQMKRYNPSIIIMPGVGNGSYMMRSLIERGFVDFLQEWAQESMPLLGICVGAQVLLDSTEEGDTRCLGIVPGVCRRFDFYKNIYSDMHTHHNKINEQLCVPHMGWNTVEASQSHERGGLLCDSALYYSYYYFVHSYYLDTDTHHCIASTDYGLRFSSIIGMDKTIGTQFHPEKSGKAGLALLYRFLTKVCGI